MSFIIIAIFILTSLVVLAFALFFIFQFVSIFTTDAPFVPFPKIAEKEIIKTLTLTENSTLYDLGCGDGRILILASKWAKENNISIKCVGVEIGIVPYFLAKIKTARYKNIKIKMENIFNTDTSEASHIFLYLYPQVLDKLLPILRKKCKAGTKIVSCDFQSKYEKDFVQIDIDPLAPRGKKLFVYTI